MQHFRLESRIMHQQQRPPRDQVRPVSLPVHELALHVGGALTFFPLENTGARLLCVVHFLHTHTTALLRAASA
jgi:hypothetical protein